jgi:hypothetical protein
MYGKKTALTCTALDMVYVDPIGPDFGTPKR